MSTLAQELSALKTAEDKITGNKVANFAYDDYAYEHDDANGVDTYNVNNHQNIPNGTANILKVNPTILTKGWRAQASAITRMLIDHFLGRCSYNLNKINDHFSSLLTKLMSYLGAPNGIATLDSEGHLAEQAPVGSAYTPITRAFLGAVFGRLMCYTWTQGTGENTTYSMGTPVYANRLWVCSSTNNHGMWWSEDGKSWTQGTGENTTYSMGTPVYANRLWVCSSTNNHGMWWSEDGKSWTQGTGDNVTYSMKTPIYVNGIWVCSSSSHGMWWSEDGKAWTQGTGSNTTYSMGTPVYANELWVCASTDNHGIWWSEDGKSWTRGTGDNTAYTMGTPVYANGLWVCGGCAPYIGSSGQGMWWSEDGKGWTQGTGGNTTYSMQYTSYVNGIWFSCSSDSHGIWWSTNGKSWAQGTGGITTYDVRPPVYANGLWVCASTDNHGILWSEDGKAWTQCTGATSGNFGFPVYTNGLWVCLAYNSIWRSEDGKAWLKSSFPQISTRYAEENVVYAVGIWVTGSGMGGIWYSSVEDLIADGTINLGADIPIVNS